ncbi:uncharacterized protein N7477_002801, partial [Penicillium maclennaniae]|uniref:uncharacterized protein n=1 Tax=Penicillium maclennaniae TaxID=1343394 RepID=UPI0025417A93
ISRSNSEQVLETEKDVFERIRAEDRQELSCVASNFTRHRATDSGVGGMTDMERKDTLAGLELDDPVLDPTSDQFEHYKWARMMLKLMDKEGVPLRKSTDVNNVGSIPLAPFRSQEYISCGKRVQQKHILREFDGVLKSGELLIVLGRPGSGCSTFLKSLSGELHGLKVGKGSDIQFNGIAMEKMHKEFREKRLNGISRTKYAKHITQVAMSVWELSHTYNTEVGDDYIWGVSGGERKRVSIAEMALSGAPVGAWDNSTRGLDSASALDACHSVAIYQASQAIYDVFNKVIVLYEGWEIFFGPVGEAKGYFVDMGWKCPSLQTTGDFLTSVTNPQERTALKGMENKVPRTPDDFAAYWEKSPHYVNLKKEIAHYREEYPLGGAAGQEFDETKRLRQATHVRPNSPYVISIPMQVRLCVKRAYQRIWNDKPSTLTTVIGRIIKSLIIGSIYFGTPNASAGFQSKGAALFFSVLLNALINIPVKLFAAVIFDVIFYFLASLRYEPSQFFIFFLFTFLSTLAMPGIFRTLAASTKTFAQAMSMAGVIVLAIVIYTGFVITALKFHGLAGFAGLTRSSTLLKPLLQISFTVIVWNALNSSRDTLICRATPSSVLFVALLPVKERSLVTLTSERNIIITMRMFGEILGSENEKDTSAIPSQHDFFTWRDVCDDIPVKGGERRLLDHVSGWVKPGTLTALMGVSGARKTTLLDVLAERVSIGVVTGDMLVNNKPLDTSFQRKTGYVQQQDLHRSSSFDNTDFADAIVGTPGEGLNVEQRKLLTIGVELAAKPALLIFLDEPTSACDMLEIIGAGASGHAAKDWSSVWKDKQQSKDVQTEITRIHDERASASNPQEGDAQVGEYAMPFMAQLWCVTHRSFQGFWREPSYVWAKIMLATLSSLFIGFTFWRPDNSLQGFQDVIFSVFMMSQDSLLTLPGLCPSSSFNGPCMKCASGPLKPIPGQHAFLISNIIVEIPYQIFAGVVAWACYYYPVYEANQASHRQGLMLLFIVQFYIFTSTFATFIISALPDAETGGTIATLMFIMTLTFNGVMQPPSALPGFWIFMYRVPSLTYSIAGITATGLHGRNIQCSTAELSVFNPPSGLTCGAYLNPYATAAGGQLYNPAATVDCQYCQLTNADHYLASSNISNAGVISASIWAYIGFNIMGTVLMYYMFRVKTIQPNFADTWYRGKEADNGRLV